MKCLIKWVDCQCETTPDNNEAVGYAIDSGGRRFPICADHKRLLDEMISMNYPRVHFDDKCKHFSRFYDPKQRWTFEPFSPLMQAAQNLAALASKGPDLEMERLMEESRARDRAEDDYFRVMA